MRLERLIRIFLFLILVIFLISSSLLAGNSSIFINIGGLLNGGFVVGYGYYFSNNIVLRGLLEIISVSQSGYSGSAIMFCIGIQYFFQDFSGFFLGADLGLGNVKIEEYSYSANLFRGFAGYRFLLGSFYIDPGFVLGVVALSGISISRIGILLEIGFLF